uniref:E3 ubiquitin-protein ligase E3D n=1 Tax=Phallusia mammillata TaxID=59560 RepID=A0A6F9DWB2_9ASCI|nr:E3 ubiquitin-protein ligase E3D [Phallusia mammillata]
MNDDCSYFMEVYDRIRSLDVVLRGDDDPKQLTIQPNEVIVKRADDSEDKYPLVVECEPTSCTSVQCHPNEGVGVRLQMRESNAMPQTGLLSTSIKRVGSELSRMEKGVCQCGCKTCGLALFVNNVKFNRVLPLPSQSWRELFNHWSCCSHKTDKESDSSKNIMNMVRHNVLRPREGDCLLSDFHIYVHAKSVNRRNVLLRDYTEDVNKEDLECAKEQRVRCARCRADIGEILLSEDYSIDAFKLSKHNIEILSLRKQMSETIIRPIFFSEFFLERLLAQQLVTSVQTHSSHLIIIQDYQDNPYLLIRVFNTKTRLYVNNGTTSTEYAEPAAVSSREIPPKVSKSETAAKLAKKAGEISRKNRQSHQCEIGDHDTTQSINKTSMTISDADKIRKDGPPHIVGNKVAEVIEKLFSFSTNLISIGRTSNDIRAADPTGCERIVKVMYASHQQKIKEVSKAWIEDDRTLSLHYPRQVCIQMLLVLVSSTLTMPVAHRVIDDFMVGFLRID